MEKETSFKKKKWNFHFHQYGGQNTVTSPSSTINIETQSWVKIFLKYFLKCITHKLASRKIFKDIKMKTQQRSKRSTIWSQMMPYWCLVISRSGDQSPWAGTWGRRPTRTDELPGFTLKQKGDQGTEQGNASVFTDLGCRRELARERARILTHIPALEAE